MAQGTILDAARRDNTALFSLFVILTVICGGVVALNWTYVYNFATGPYPLTKALASSPGMREFVRAEGALIDTNAQEVSKTRFHGRGLGRLLAAAGNATSKEQVSARVELMALDGGLLVVKVPPEFSGRVVEGRLTPLSKELQGALGSDMTVYPYMLDAKNGYRWDFNLFILVAAPVFPLAVLGLVFAIRQKRDVMRHRALVKLARHGLPLALIPRIEKEMAAAVTPAESGPLWITPNWIVGLSPSLNIFAVRDLVAISHEAIAKKERDKVVVSHTLNVWTRDELMPDVIDVNEHEAAALLDTLRTQHPWVIVDDTAAFKTQWNRDKDTCTRDADARRKAAAAAAKAASTAAPAAPAAPPDAPSPAPSRTRVPV